MQLFASTHPTANLSLSLIYLFAVVFWVAIFGSPFVYFFIPALPGQGWYLFAKFFGVLAVIALWSQSMLGVLGGTRFGRNFLGNSRTLHQANGVVALALILLHVSCFVTATSIRGGHLTYHLLLPDFSSYYSSMISIGLLALMVLLMATCYPLRRWRRRYLNVLSLRLHRLGILSVLMVFWHSLAIGSETRMLPMTVLYIFLMLTLILAIVYRVHARWSN